MQKLNRTHLLTLGRHFGACLAFLLCLLLLTSSGWGAEKAEAPPAPKAMTPSPDARLILQKMCEFLKSQQQFTYKAEVVYDQVYQGGKKFNMALIWRPLSIGLTDSGSTPRAT